MADEIYLDHNATTPLDPRVGEEMLRAWRDFGANPASQHAPGRRARRRLEDCREGIAQLLGARTGGMHADRLIFTSGGTEANHLVLHGCLAAGDRLVVSALEHPSVSRAAEALSRRGILLERLGVDSTGRVRADVPLSGARLISVMLASNETGVIQPVAQLAMRAREAGTLVHTDAVQAVGKIPVDFGALGVDAMTVAPHKFHGPIGIGALVVRREAALEPAMAGGFQQEGLRPGTEGVALAVGFHAALRLAVGELPARAAHMETLRDDLERRLAREIDEVVVLGGEAPRLPGTACLAFPGVDRQQMMMALDLSGVACSTGSACASGSSEPSAALVAMGLPERVISSAVRFSLGATTTAVEVEQAAIRISLAVNRLRSAK